MILNTGGQLMMNTKGKFKEEVNLAIRDMMVDADSIFDGILKNRMTLGTFITETEAAAEETLDALLVEKDCWGHQLPFFEYEFGLHEGGTGQLALIRTKHHANKHPQKGWQRIVDLNNKAKDLGGKRLVDCQEDYILDVDLNTPLSFVGDIYDPCGDIPIGVFEREDPCFYNILTIPTYYPINRARMLSEGE